MHATASDFARIYNNSARGASDSLREARACAGATLVILELKTWTRSKDQKEKHYRKKKLQ